MNYSSLEKNIKNIQKDFDESLIKFKKDDIFNNKESIYTKWTVYTKEDKKRIKRKWSDIKNNFVKLKKIIDISKFRYLFTLDFNNFLVSYYSVNIYYNNLRELNKAFWIHEEFIRQLLDDKFEYNYNSISSYIYRYKFYYFLNYPRKFVILLTNRVDKDLYWIIDEIKKWENLRKEQRFFFDRKNIYYYFRHKSLSLQYYISKYIWNFFSSMKFKTRKYWLITTENQEKCLKQILPWDIILIRSNWIWKNILIPGFWKHMSMYLWIWKYIKDNFKKSPKWLIDDSHYIIEAVWLWVRIVEFKEICKYNDYLWVIRPKFSDDKKHRAIKEAMQNLGMKYDFLFNYYSDKSFVCSELITKSYLKENKDDEWLTIKLEKIGLGLTYPPNNIVKKMDEEKELKNKELEVIIFIDSLERKKINFINESENDFLSSWNRTWFSGSFLSNVKKTRFSIPVSIVFKA